MPSIFVRRSACLARGRFFATSRSLPPQPTTIRPSTTEIQSQRLDPRNLEAAVRHMLLDGLVVVEDVIGHADIDHLNAKMEEDARVLQAKGDDGPYNYNRGNLQQDAPPVADYFSPSIFTSEDPIATQISSAVLGPRPKWTFCSGNTAMPLLRGSLPQRQPVHSDADFAHPEHPFALVVNVPLVTMMPENGSTEVWLGTHTFDQSAQEGFHGERASGRIKEAFLQERLEVRPPSQPIVKKGSIVIRDLRLWHAGMPNHTQNIRVMLAMIHFAPWYRNQMRLHFANNIKAILEEHAEGLEIPVEWLSNIEASKGYLERPFGNSYDFGQTLS